MWEETQHEDGLALTLMANYLSPLFPGEASIERTVGLLLAAEACMNLRHVVRGKPDR